MASDTLSDAQKREVLETWLDELQRKSGDEEEARSMRRSIQEQLDKLA